MPLSISPPDPRWSFATMKFAAGESTAVSAAASKNTHGPSRPVRSKCAPDHVPPKERLYGRLGKVEKRGNAGGLAHPTGTASGQTTPARPEHVRIPKPPLPFALSPRTPS